MTLKTPLLLAVSAGARLTLIAFATERPELEVGESWFYQRVDLTTNQVSG